jgi:hypothetical protein
LLQAVKELPQRAGGVGMAGNRLHSIVWTCTYTFTTASTTGSNAQHSGIYPFDSVFWAGFNTLGADATLPTVIEDIKAINGCTVQMKSGMTMAGSTTSFT